MQSYSVVRWPLPCVNSVNIVNSILCGLICSHCAVVTLDRWLNLQALFCGLNIMCSSSHCCLMCDNFGVSWGNNFANDDCWSIGLTRIHVYYCMFAVFVTFRLKMSRLIARLWICVSIVLSHCMDVFAWARAG